MALYLFFCLVIVGVTYYVPNPPGDWLSAHFGLMCFPVWMVLLMSGTSYRSLLFWQVPSTIHCDSNGIQVTYWLLPRSKRVAWNEIQAMELGPSEFVLRTLGQTVKCLLLTPYGRQDYPGLVRTVADHASIYFVGVMGGNYVYKRFTAP